MRLTKAEIASLGLAVIAAATPILAWDQLPAATQVYWGLALLPDLHAPKPWGPFVLPAVSAAICVSALWVARRGSEQARAATMSAAGRTVQFAVQAFLLLLTLAPLLVGAGLAASVDRIAVAGLGLLLIVVGNGMGKLRRNPLWGIRTRWTLASDETWLLTHRVAGWLTALSGFALLAAGVADRGFAAAVVVLAAAVAASIAYSLMVHRRLAAREGDDA